MGKRWIGDVPKQCDMCKSPIAHAFVDGATRYNSPGAGRWASMCLKCHKVHGMGLGVGMGQQYEKEVDAIGAWVKVGPGSKSDLRCKRGKT